MQRLRLFLICSIFLIHGCERAAADDSTKTSQATRIEFDQRVRMRDGVELSADVYRPSASGRFPVILLRTPYNKVGGGASVARFRAIAARGYVVVNQDVRGRGDSDGIFEPWRREGLDGYDTIEWCAAQPWSNGKVGTTGGSYLGYDQWVAAVQQPPHLTTMIALVSPSDPFVEDPSGVTTPMNISWYHFTSGHANQNMEAVDWARIHKHLPQVDMDDAAGRHMPFWKELFKHTKLDDWWEPCRYQNKFDKVNVPVLHISGWYDDEQVGTPLNFHGMTTKRVAGVRPYQKLVMGPWPHRVNSTSKLGKVDFGKSAIIDMDGLQMRWFDRWLKGIDNGVDKEPKVRIFAMGANQWRDEQEWLLPGTQWTKYYLHSKGHANTRTRPPEAAAASYDAEPGAARSCVRFTTGPREQEVEVTGPIKLKLWVSSTSDDADLFAIVRNLRPDGTEVTFPGPQPSDESAVAVAYGWLRLSHRKLDPERSTPYRPYHTHDEIQKVHPGEVVPVEIEILPTSAIFERGHRLVIEVGARDDARSFFQHDDPRDRIERGTVSLHTGGRFDSHVLLPIIPATRSGP